MTRTLLLALALATACRAPEETTGTTTPGTPTVPGRPDTTTLPTVGEPEWLAALRALPGVTIDGLYEDADATQVSLSFLQPVDHDAPAGGPTFQQHALLRHRDAHAPTVLSTYGYRLVGLESEPSLLLKGNELELEKRFDGSSVPADRADLDWTTLTAAQVAADAHHVVELLQPVYDGAWIGTGGSNGGIDALSHRMHHPDDLAATIAYVAPMMNSLDDDRIDAHFTEDVDPTCQAAVQKLQLALMTDLRADYLASATLFVDTTNDYYAYYGYDPGLTFDRVGGVDRSLQIAMIEFPFVFWQYQGNPGCDLLPDPEVDPVAAVEYGVYSAWLPNGPTASDATLEAFGAYFVSVNTYLGYPSTDPTLIAASVDPDLVGPNPAIYLPPDAPVPTFDPIGPRLQAWLDDSAENVVLIDGGLDPFSRVRGDTAAADPTVMSFLDPDGTHQARLQDLTDPEVDDILAALADWIR